MKTAIIYTRVSSEEQVMGTSLDSQLADCERYAEAQGFEVVQTFCDAGLSAKTTKRPALQNAIAYASREKVDAFIVWKLDRLSRKTSDGLLIRSALKRVGCELVSATEAIASDPTGDLVSTLLLGVAEFDNAQRAIRCKRGMEETVAKGGWVFKHPTGFVAAKNKEGLPILLPDPIQGPAIQSILKAFAHGAITKTEFYQRMERIGISPKRASALARKHVYAGLIVSNFTNGEPVKAAFEGLITPEEFYAIQERFQDYRPRTPEVFTDERAVWKGIVRCAKCGHPLTVYTSKGCHYYKCRNCRGFNLRDKLVHAEARKILAEAKELSAILSVCVDVARTKAAEIVKAKQAEALAAEKKVAEAKAKRRRLVDAYIEGKIPEDIYKEKLAELSTFILCSNSEEKRKNEDINAVVSTLSKAVKTLENPGLLIQSLPPQSVHQIILHTIGHIELHPDRTISVCSNQPRPTLKSLLTPENTTLNNKKDAENRASSNSPLLWWTYGADVLTLCRKIEAVVECGVASGGGGGSGWLRRRC